VVEQPQGTVTFLFTDIEGSTRLLTELGAERYAELLEQHRRALRDAFGRHGGYEVDCEGDAFFAAFQSARGAAAAAAEAQAALGAGPMRVRIGLHTGEALLAPPKYVGIDVHRTARIMAAAHGGQILVSQQTRQLIEAELRDLGLHRLKDLGEPLRLYQLGEGEFPPPRSLYRTKLPAPATPFVGRERELEEVVSLLGRDGVRLLTLTGPGGSGKTRLALQAAAEIAERYPDGVFWVGLAALRDPALVLPTVGHEIGGTEDVAYYVSAKRLLLLLDNLEQVLDAGPELAELLSACPNLDLLVTSREPLHLTVEHEYPVPPLAEDEAVHLFQERAASARPGVATSREAAGICRRLDCLPLAVELAAARVRVLTAAQILSRLQQRLPLLTGGPRDAPERQQTLRDTIAWSYDLLGEQDRRLFIRLSVFAGGCTLEAAEHVCDGAPDTLQSLVEKSLLRQRDDRFGMLETIREFATEQLEASGEADKLRRRHAAWFRALAERSPPLPEFGPGDQQWLDRLAGEHDNLRAALAWTEQHRELEAMARILIPLSVLWITRGHLLEAEEWLERALSAAPSGNPALRADVMSQAGRVAAFRGEVERAEGLQQTAVSIYRSLGDRPGVAFALAGLGFALAPRGEYDRAVAAFNEARQLAQRHGPRRVVAVAAVNLGDLMLQQGRLEESSEFNEEARRLFSEIADASGEAIAQMNLGYAAMLAGRYEDALVLYRRSLEALHRNAVAVHGSSALLGVAWALALRGQHEPAARLLGAGAALFETAGAKVEWWMDAATRREARRVLSEHLSGEAFQALTDEGEGMTFDEAVALAVGSTE
jgi:predicted ATPase/class 3 adenylate cyclase